MITTHLALFSFFKGMGSPSSRDTHDGIDDVTDLDRAIRKRDEEFKRRREKLRADLLRAVTSVTGKPPPLDAPLKSLAAIARPAIDYREVIRDIEDIETRSREAASAGVDAIERRQAEQAKAAIEAAQSLELARRVEAARKLRRMEEEATLMLLARL